MGPVRPIWRMPLSSRPAVQDFREESWLAHTESCLLWPECKALPPRNGHRMGARCRPAVRSLSASCNLASLCLAGFIRLTLANPRAHKPLPSYTLKWQHTDHWPCQPARPLSSLLSMVCTLRHVLNVTLMLPCPCEFECWLFNAVSYLMKNVSWPLYLFCRYPSPPPPSFFSPVSVFTWIQSSSF